MDGRTLFTKYSYGFVVCGLHLLCYLEALVQHSVIMRTTRRLRESGGCVGQLGGPRVQESTSQRSYN